MQVTRFKAFAASLSLSVATLIPYVAWAQESTTAAGLQPLTSGINENVNESGSGSPASSIQNALRSNTIDIQTNPQRQGLSLATEQLERDVDENMEHIECNAESLTTSTLLLSSVVFFVSPSSQIELNPETPEYTSLFTLKDDVPTAAGCHIPEESMVSVRIIQSEDSRGFYLSLDSIFLDGHVIRLQTNQGPVISDWIPFASATDSVEAITNTGNDANNFGVCAIAPALPFIFFDDLTSRESNLLGVFSNQQIAIGAQNFCRGLFNGIAAIPEERTTWSATLTSDQTYALLSEHVLCIELPAAFRTPETVFEQRGCVPSGYEEASTP